MGLRSAPPVMEQLPSIDSIISGVQGGTGQSEAAKSAEGKQEIKEENLDRIDREQKHRREQFRSEQRIKDLEKQLANSSNKTSVVDTESKNPFKDIVKAKGMSQDEIVRLALEAMDDDLSPEEKKDEFKNMSPSEIAELVKKQLKEEQELEAKNGAETKAISDFKASIVSRAKEVDEQYPLIGGLGGEEQVYAMIEQQFLADSKEFGEKYAQENMLNVDEAIKKTNESLAISVKEALKSKHLRQFLLKAIKDDSGEVEDQSHGDDQLKEREVTLNNRDFRAGTEPAGKPQFKSDRDELDFLINKFI